MKRRIGNIIAIMLIALLLHPPFLAISHAAGKELSPSAKSAMTKMTESTATVQASSMNTMYSELIALQNQILQRDGSLKKLQAKNKETLTNIRSRLQQWDTDKINKLEASLKQTRQRYEPLFASYQLLNDQISRTVSKKDERKEMLRKQRDIVKAAVQLARMDIKAKVGAVKKARDSRSKFVKRVREILAGIPSVNAQMKSERSRVSELHKRATPLWSSLHRAVKKGDAKSSLQSLTSLVSLIRQIDQSKKKLEQHEARITEILHKARAAFA
ncbi:hypothetical protein [Paenibacillus sp. S-12]|uniref:hypothetical protein n=1 Tax=Paenibacillus sp. S-12 TaxID=3031371 RepID=UPI0025A2EE28|nr:hypothetical protein [Paenibacillus sp. S-12]